MTVNAEAKGTGSLAITAPDSGNAGIGGDSGEKCGTVKINGGILRVKGGENAQAIGGDSDTNSGKLILGEMLVKESEGQKTPKAAEERVKACRLNTVYIASCKDHEYSEDPALIATACSWCGKSGKVIGHGAFILPSALKAIKADAFAGMEAVRSIYTRTIAPPSEVGLSRAAYSSSSSVSLTACHLQT